ncbi:MAG: hypothetical protein M1833_003773 [Piccolia ochrophora]|nr:MAG: hypothetical protein M1833_003773 [Piccolia ochrophora]
MSSPMPFGGPVPPVPLSSGGGNEQGGGNDATGIEVRPMMLKVLYTFDDSNKTNCLARWPHVMSVQTVLVDDGTLIGVCQLKTCIQAIVSASPELVAKLGQDYTVYAYDYSEYETPLVGQGMLSWALAAASSTPGAPAHQSRTVVTGRVCRNILGVFSNGVKDTLEVKLRLVPVPTCLQSEYIGSLEKYRDISKVIPMGLDGVAWTAFLQANPNLAELASRITDQPYAKEQRAGGEGADFVARLLRQAAEPAAAHYSPYETRAESSESTAQTTAPTPYPSISRFGSPAPSVGDMTQFSAVPQVPPSRPVSRPASRGSKRSFENLMTPSEGISATGQAVGSNGAMEEGGPKKRARVTKTDWNGKSSIGEGADCLRVAASNAASMRLFRPVAVHPTSNPSGSLEEIPRAPTPPAAVSNPRARNQPLAQSGLRRESFDASSGMLRRPSHPFLDVVPSIESMITSPEGNRSCSETPFNIPSSPPELTGPSPAASSPTLPTLPQQIDSGFASGAMDDLFEDYESQETKRSRNGSAQQPSQQHRPTPVKQFEIREEVPGPPGLLPNRIPPRLNQKKATQSISAASSPPAASPEESQTLPSKAKRPSRPRPPRKPKTKLLPKVPVPTASNESAASAPTLTRTPSIGNLSLPQQVASDPVAPRIPLQRSQTWAGNDHAKSDAPVPKEVQKTTETKATLGPTKPRSGSGVKRRQAIQNRLEQAIESGEMPPYCENCGSIDTPTWRKAWSKVIEGSPESVCTSEEEGGIIAVLELERDDAGKVKSFSIVKKTLTDDDEGFKETQLCNPCGLWLYKFKCMRPQERWNKEHREPGKRKRKSAKPKTQSGLSTNESSGGNDSQDGAPAMDRTYSSEGTQQRLSIDVDEEPPLKRQRAASLQPEHSIGRSKGGLDEAAAAEALKRAIQSSPVRNLGSQLSPINLEGLGSTKRLLFPSPQQRAIQRQESASPSVHKLLYGQQANKENCPPPAEEEDDILRLFEDDDEPPATPTRISPRINPFKTPSKLTPLKQTTTSRTPMKVFSSIGKDALLPPRTPSSHERSSPKSLPGSAVQYSPFTAQLAQVLSEANCGSPSTMVFSGFDDLMPTASALASQRGATLLDLTTDGVDPFSTDAVMPSSPPPTFFTLYEDPVLPESGLWSDYVFEEEVEKAES